MILLILFTSLLTILLYLYNEDTTHEPFMSQTGVARALKRSSFRNLNAAHVPLSGIHGKGMRSALSLTNLTSMIARSDTSWSRGPQGQSGNQGAYAAVCS
jgi:hypothetical protein